VPALHAVSRFSHVDADGRWSNQLRDVAELLAAQDGCLSVTVGRSIDDPASWVLSSEWESVGQYRRALSTFDVKVNGVPVLSRAIDEPGAFEVLYGNRAGTVTEATSALNEGDTPLV
jgi:hypothetical protein